MTTASTANYPPARGKPWLLLVSTLLIISVAFNIWFFLQQRDQRQYAASQVTSTANITSSTLLAVPRFLADEREHVAYSRLAQAKGWASSAQVMVNHTPRDAAFAASRLADLAINLERYDNALLNRLLGAATPEDEALIAEFISVMEQAEAGHPGTLRGDADWEAFSEWLERLNAALTDAARTVREAAAFTP